MPAVCQHRHPGIPIRFLPESRRFSGREATPRHMGNPPQPSGRKREQPGMQKRPKQAPFRTAPAVFPSAKLTRLSQGTKTGSHHTFKQVS